MDTATVKPVATEEESADVEPPESETGSEEGFSATHGDDRQTCFCADTN